VTRRTDLELLIDALKEQTGNQASRKELATLLNWEQEKVHRVALRGVAETASRRTRLSMARSTCSAPRFCMSRIAA
jgi:predicted Zn-ribbon and HTH transcriptional regulator